MATQAEVDALVDAMDQLLDDMGMAGTSVCLAAKAQARVAIEPFLKERGDAGEWLMSFADAQQVLKECDG